MTREILKQPDRDPLTKGDREFLSGNEKGEFTYSADNRTMLDTCCSRGFLTPVEGEFVFEKITANRVRLTPLYRLTDAGAAALAWVPPAADEAAEGGVQ
jgi:hypothetical protein